MQYSRDGNLIEFGSFFGSICFVIVTGVSKINTDINVKTEKVTTMKIKTNNVVLLNKNKNLRFLFRTILLPYGCDN